MSPFSFSDLLMISSSVVSFVIFRLFSDCKLNLSLVEYTKKFIYQRKNRESFVFECDLSHQSLPLSKYALQHSLPCFQIIRLGLHVLYIGFKLNFLLLLLIAFLLDHVLHLLIRPRKIFLTILLTNKILDESSTLCTSFDDLFVKLFYFFAKDLLLVLNFLYKYLRYLFRMRDVLICFFILSISFSILRASSSTCFTLFTYQYSLEDVYKLNRGYQDRDLIFSTLYIIF